MKVSVLGGTGFVGRELVSRLATAGHTVLVPTRRPRDAQALGVLASVEIVEANVHDPGALSRLFGGCDVVINLVGILNERGRSGAGFRHAHTELARKVVDAARNQRVARILQMSGLGTDATNPQSPPSHYLRSKSEAERIVLALDDVDWTIFRPCVIFGPADSLLNRFAGLLPLTGGVLPLARAHTRFAPIHVADVAEAFMRALHGGATSRQIYELCGPEVLTLGELVRVAGVMIGRRAHVIPLPDAVARVQAFVMDFLPGKPFSTDNFRSLSRDSLCRDDGCARLGIEPRSLRAYVQTARLRSVAGRRASSRTAA